MLLDLKSLQSRCYLLYQLRFGLLRYQSRHPVFLTSAYLLTSDHLHITIRMFVPENVGQPLQLGFIVWKGLLPVRHRSHVLFITFECERHIMAVGWVLDLF